MSVGNAVRIGYWRSPGSPSEEDSFEHPTSAQTITSAGTDLDHAVGLQPSQQRVMMHRRDMDYYV